MTEKAENPPAAVRRESQYRRAILVAHLLARALLLGQYEVSVELLEADALEDAFRVIG